VIDIPIGLGQVSLIGFPLKGESNMSLSKSKWKFGGRSKRLLEEVNPKWVRVAERALEISDIDFGVICGMRTLSEQRLLFDSPASRTMKSKHLTGDAIDILTYLGRRGSYDSRLYFEVAEAIKTASIELGIPVRWGGCWKDIGVKGANLDEYVAEYVARKVSQGKRTFLDFCHFELI
jgi:peptidoglycan L-alanyl-D-glutamate endopeptidase CwlK